VKKGKVCVPVTELRHLFEHLNQLFTVDTVGVVMSGQFILQRFWFFLSLAKEACSLLMGGIT